MTNEAAKYRKAVKKQLLCCGSTRKRLLEKLDTLLASYTEENGSVTTEDLILAFGPPEETARTLMAEVTPQEHKRFQQTRLFKRIAAGILAAALALFTVYVLLIKEFSLSVYDEVFEEDADWADKYSVPQEVNPE